MAQVLQAAVEEVDELRDLLVEFDLPAVACERRLLLEDTCCVGREHEDKLFDLAVLLHLALETVDHELGVEFGHGTAHELVRVSVTWVNIGRLRAARHARRILAHGDVLQLVLQHLEHLLGELDALGSIPHILEEVGY